MSSQDTPYAHESAILDRLKSRLQAIRTDASDPSLKTFVPEDSLDEIYNHGEVEKVLNHPKFAVAAYKRASTADIVVKFAQKVFSIVLELNYEQGLVALIENDLLDLSIPFDLSLLHKVIPEVAVSFEILQWTYKAYKIQSGLYHKQIVKQQILPYLSRTKVGGGGYSNVYQVVIHRSHQNILPPGQTNGVTAIEKQLQPPLKDPKAESELLFLLKTIRHPNVVELLASYTQNSVTSLLFRPADMNLHELLLRSDRPDAFIHDSSILQAVQGLASGLAHLHNFRPRLRSSPDLSEVTLHGYHHDIKPKNILAFGSSLVLADFGFSKLKAENEDTQTRWKHTTFEYGAPECRDMITLEAGTIGRSLDIWSLACVISEILTYLQFGDEGVTKFRDSRIFEQQYGVVRCFHDGKDVSTVVDKQLTDIEFATDSDAVSAAIRTVRQMFSSTPNHRHSAEKVESSLARISVLALVERLLDAVGRLFVETDTIKGNPIFMAHLKLEETKLRAWCYALGLIKHEGTEGRDDSRMTSVNHESYHILEATCNDISDACNLDSEEDYHDFILSRLDFMNRSLYARLSTDTRSSTEDIFRVLLTSSIHTSSLELPSRNETGNLDFEASTLAAIRYMTVLLEKDDKEMSRGHRIEADLIRKVSTTADWSIRPPVWTYSHGYKEEESRKVLVEFIPYWKRKHSTEDEDEFKEAVESMLWRVQELAALLMFERKPIRFRTLPCLGTFHDARSQRFGLVYGFPFEDSLPIRLSKLLYSGKNSIIYPDLAQRWSLAKTLISCVQTFHMAGWLHKNISSFNILFFPRPHDDWTAVDLSKPYVIGFDHSRPDGKNEYSQGPILTVGPSKEYFHPDYRLRKTKFQRAFDYYALGLLLLEIGTWNPLSNEYEKHPDWSPSRLKKEYVDICSRSLGGFMGPTYRKATMACLEHDFGTDDEQQQLIFQRKVVDMINICRY